MRNSAGLGDLLSEEVEDVVVWNGEDQNGENRQVVDLTQGHEVVDLTRED